MRVTSTRPEGIRALSLSAAGIEPVSSRASIFSAIVLPDARELVDAALLAPARRPRHAGLADRLRRVAVGDHPVYDGAVELVRLASSSNASAISPLRMPELAYAPPCPDAWLILPTYNEAENIEPLVRAVLPQLASTGLEHTDPDRGRQLARRHRRRSPTGWPRSATRVRVLHRPRKEGLGRAYLAGFEAALAGGAELILEMDADFSHDPADLPRLIAATRRGRPRARLALRAGRRRRRLGRAAALLSRGGSRVRAAAARRAGARPDRRLQVLPPARAGDDRPRAAFTPTATASRSS